MATFHAQAGNIIHLAIPAGKGSPHSSDTSSSVAFFTDGLSLFSAADPSPPLTYLLISVERTERPVLELRSCVKVEVAVLVPNSTYGLCGRKATLNSGLRSCVKVEVAVLGS